MHVVLNGAPKELNPGDTVAALLDHLNLRNQPCAVEVNRDLVTKSKHEAHTLHDGDQVEIVTLVGGG